MSDSKLLDLLQDVVVKADGIETVDALLIAVAGDDVAGGLMLRRIIYWHEKMGRTFYMSARDWWEQARITESVVKRIKKKILPGCGVDVVVKRAGGIPTTHYTLKADRFLQAVATVAGVDLPEPQTLATEPPEESTVSKRRNAPDGNGAGDGSETAESTVSLTSNTQAILTSNTDKPLPPVGGRDQTPSEKLLISDGMRPVDARKFSELPDGKVSSCIADSHRAAERGAIRTSRQAYLKGSLKNALAEWQETQRDNPFVGMSWSDHVSEPFAPDRAERVPSELSDDDAVLWRGAALQFELQQSIRCDYRRDLQLIKRDGLRFVVEVAAHISERYGRALAVLVRDVFGLGRHLRETLAVDGTRWEIEFVGSG